MYRKLSKLGAVKTERNWSRSERNVGVSCTGGLLVARVPGCCATPRIPPGRKEVAIPHAYLAPGKVRNPNSVVPHGGEGPGSETTRISGGTRSASMSSLPSVENP